MRPAISWPRSARTVASVLGSGAMCSTWNNRGLKIWWKSSIPPAETAQDVEAERGLQVGVVGGALGGVLEHRAGLLVEVHRDQHVGQREEERHRAGREG